MLSRGPSESGTSGCGPRAEVFSSPVNPPGIVGIASGITMSSENEGADSGIFFPVVLADSGREGADSATFLSKVTSVCWAKSGRATGSRPSAKKAESERNFLINTRFTPPIHGQKRQRNQVLTSE